MIFKSKVNESVICKLFILRISLNISPFFEFDRKVKIDDKAHSYKGKDWASYKIRALAGREIVFDFGIFAQFIDDIPENA